LLGNAKSMRLNHIVVPKDESSTLFCCCTCMHALRSDLAIALSAAEGASSLEENASREGAAAHGPVRTADC